MNILRQKQNQQESDISQQPYTQPPERVGSR